MVNKSRAPYLGKVSLFWCDQCDLPIFASSNCHFCNQIPRKVNFSPPGDVRPAFYYDYELLRATVNKTYRAKENPLKDIDIGNLIFPAEKVILLNRIGGLDRNEEVIMGGHVIGVFGFDPITREYFFHPRYIGGLIIAHIYSFFYEKKSFSAEVLRPKSIWLNDEGEQYFSKGKSILVPGVSNFSPDIEKDDYVMVYSNSSRKYLGVAVSKSNSSEINEMMKIGRGNIAKNRHYQKSTAGNSSSDIIPSFDKMFSKIEVKPDSDEIPFFQKYTDEINKLITFLFQNHTNSLPKLVERKGVNFSFLFEKSNNSKILKEFGNIIPNPWIIPTHSRWWLPNSSIDHQENKTKNYDLNLHQHILLNLFHVYAANISFVRTEINKAVRFIHRTKSKVNKSAAVAYSGGKDSLAVLLLVYRALGPNFKIFFANTGLELPEVEQNVQLVSQALQMEEKLIIRHAENTFWELLPTFGPPGRDYRYCCHSLKAQQIMELINELYEGDKVLSFLGQRQYESLNRAQSKKLYVNSFIPLQISATPIKSWISLLLWVFLLCEPVFNDSFLKSIQKSVEPNNEPNNLQEKEPMSEQFLEMLIDSTIDTPITPLYFAGHERLGCYLCPASNLATFSRLQDTHPKKHDAWFSYLSKYAEKYNLPSEWVDLGLWRYKKLPKQWKNLLKERQITYKFQNSSPSHDLHISITKGFSPCLQTGYSVKGRFSQVIDLPNLVSFLPALTSTFEYDSELEVISGNGKFKQIPFRFNLFSDGSVFLLSPERNFDYQAWFRYFFTTVYRSFFCNQCKTCINVCPTNAIIINGEQVKIQPERCSSCKKCITHCPYFQIGKSIIDATFPNSDSEKKEV